MLVWICSHGLLSRSNVKASEEFKYQINEHPELRINTGRDYKWKIAVDPLNSQIVVQLRNNEKELEHHVYSWPNYLPANPSTDQFKLIDKIDRKHKVGQSIKVLALSPIYSDELYNLDEACLTFKSSSDLISDIREYQIRSALYDWEDNFARLAKDGTNRKEVDFKRALKAFDQLLGLVVAISNSENKNFSKCSYARQSISSAIVRLKRGDNQDTVQFAGNVLLEYFDEIIAKLGDPNELPAKLQSMREQYIVVRASYAKDLNCKSED